MPAISAMVIRIDADGYGANNCEQDAADLAAWLNHLRELALDKQLAPDEAVEVPEGFRGNAIPAIASGSGSTRARTQTVVRR